MSVLSSGIYYIRNSTTQKMYIGSAVNVAKRQMEHLYGLRHGMHCNYYLQATWDKYGEDDFLFGVLLYCNKEHLILFEQRALDVLGERYGWNMLFNICLCAGSTLGKMHSEQTKAKIALTSKNRWIGKHHTDETKAKMSNAQKSRIITLHARGKLSEAMKGKHGPWTGKKRPPRSVEWIEKHAITLRGRHLSEETKARISAANKGRVSPFRGKHGTRLGIKNKSKVT